MTSWLFSSLNGSVRTGSAQSCHSSQVETSIPAAPAIETARSHPDTPTIRTQSFGQRQAYAQAPRSYGRPTGYARPSGMGTPGAGMQARA